LNVTSCHNDCLNKRAVGDRAVGKQARKYILLWEGGCSMISTRRVNGRVRLQFLGLPQWIPSVAIIADANGAAVTDVDIPSPQSTNLYLEARE
jgi:hypothetical protein